MYWIAFTSVDYVELQIAHVVAPACEPAVILEPMVGGGGCIPAQKEFIEALAGAARAVGAVLIFDEVMTSRMSGGGQQERLGIVPDLVAMGKYMAGGMSFGAFGGRREIMELYAAELPHAGTFNNNVLSMAGGQVAMGEVFTAEIAAELFDRGETLRVRLNDVCAEAGVSMHFTGLGSMMAPHFRPGPVERPYVLTSVEEGLRELFFFDMLQTGIYLARRGMVALTLPTTDADLARFVDAVVEFVASRGKWLRHEPIGH